MQADNIPTMCLETSKTLKIRPIVVDFSPRWWRWHPAELNESHGEKVAVYNVVRTNITSSDAIIRETSERSCNRLLLNRILLPDISTRNSTTESWIVVNAGQTSRSSGTHWLIDGPYEVIPNRERLVRKYAELTASLIVAYSRTR